MMLTVLPPLPRMGRQVKRPSASAKRCVNFVARRERRETRPRGEGRLQRLRLVRKPKLGQFFQSGPRSPANVGQYAKLASNVAAIRGMRDHEHKACCSNSCLSIGASAPDLADDQKPANSQEGYLPPLNLLMVAAQLNHFKLWYAGAVENWPLANYELAQIRTSIDRASQTRSRGRREEGDPPLRWELHSDGAPNS